MRTFSLAGSICVAIHAACGAPLTPEETARFARPRESALTSTPTRPVQTPFIAMNDHGTRPAGVHSSHTATACGVCHLQGGAVQFDPRGPAIVPGTLATDSAGNVILDSNGNATILKANQLPAYNTTTGTCSNIACHWVRPGVYYAQFHFEDPVYAWTYGTPLPKPTPDWLSTPGLDICTACHGYPPKESGGIWHSDFHGGVSVTSTTDADVLGFNACSTCHVDMHSTLQNPGTPGGLIVTTVTNQAMHRNGTPDVAYNYSAMGIPSFFCDDCHYSY